MPAMLLQLYDRLGLGNSADALFWAICLVAFYGVFRKFHLLPVLTSSFDLCKQLTKAGFRIFPWGYSSPFAGVRPYNFLNGLWKFHSLAFPVPNYAPQQPSQMPFALPPQHLLSSVQLGRPKATCKNFYS